MPTAPATALNVRFARKPFDLAEVVWQLEAYASIEPQPVLLQGMRAMTKADYDAFVANFSLDCGWLAGLGGGQGAHALVIKITAPQRPTLYVNPEGYDYARYVGVADDA